MMATKAREPRKEDSEGHKYESKSRNQASLDSRYGRIGISAVAAAVKHKSVSKPRHTASSGHVERYDRE